MFQLIVLIRFHLFAVSTGDPEESLHGSECNTQRKSLLMRDALNSEEMELLLRKPPHNQQDNAGCERPEETNLSAISPLSDDVFTLSESIPIWNQNSPAMDSPELSQPRFQSFVSLGEEKVLNLDDKMSNEGITLASPVTLKTIKELDNQGQQTRSTPSDNSSGSIDNDVSLNSMTPDSKDTPPDKEEVHDIGELIVDTSTEKGTMDDNMKNSTKLLTDAMDKRAENLSNIINDLDKEDKIGLIDDSSGIEESKSQSRVSISD